MSPTTDPKYSKKTARDLRLYWTLANGESVGGRLWCEILTEENRHELGGDFAAAFVKYGRTIGIYRQLNPRVSIARAVLEVLHELGQIVTPSYRRLVEAIGERPDVPPDHGAVPVWIPKPGVLRLHGQIIRKIRQPKKAIKMTAVLDAFERLGWPPRVPLIEIGNCKLSIRQTIYDLNDGLEAIKFAMDGHGTGVVWRVEAPRAAVRRTRGNKAKRHSASTATRRRLIAGKRKRVVRKKVSGN